MRSQTIVWTALPNGRGGGALNLSVFVMPRLQTDEGGDSPRLSLFPDFANWPATVTGAPLSFTVTFGDGPAVDAALDTTFLSPGHWAAMFDPATTAVQPWQYYDFATVPLLSFPAASVEAYLQEVYGRIGRESPTTFPSRELLLADPFFGPARPGSVGERRSPKGSGARTLGPRPDDAPVGASGAIAQALDFHVRPPRDPAFTLPPPTLDFHEALSLLKAYPRLMRMLGLVLDLRVPLPAGLPSGTTVRVTPTWQPALAGPATSTQNASPFTNCTVGPSFFRATPRGADYRNGMLNLADANRFSVIEVDVDGAAERAAMFAATLEQTIAGGTDDTPEAYAPPSLRSLGLSVVWSGWADALSRLAAAQSDKQYQLEESIRNPDNVAPPTFDAEDLVRGHWFDVYSSSDPSPSWRSLVGRVGRYVFPRGSAPDFSHEDEGAVVAAGTQAAGTVEPPLPDLYVHETLARWAGWSLAARRPGRHILPGPEDGVGGDPGNPVPPPGATGDVTIPQLSATFAAPVGSLPRLRFGHRYRFRARAADLAGNGVPLTSDDDSTATAPVTHSRFDPVVTPVLAPTAPYGPGQGSQLVAILNDSVPGSTIAPLGLWLFPPKGSQLLAEEHGMFDGFVRGSPPDPARGPSGDAATYELIVSREHASLDDGNPPRDPVRNTPYFPATRLTTPWLPDPLSTGVAMVGLPGEAADASTARDWTGGRWPDLEPMLLRLSPGPEYAHTYHESTGTASAVEEATLPPAGVADVALSSTLADDRLDVLGMWHWIADGLDSGEVAILRSLARAGQVWLLTPFRVVRLVHAVRLPLVAPAFDDPRAARTYGSQQASINDGTFKVDTPSTGTLDVEATWTDPLDDPSDPSDDPTVATTTKKAHAFRLTVQDPSRPGPEFAFDEGHGAVHDLGDTKHHSVDYAVTATSRFAELFRKDLPVTFTVDSPTHVSDLGFDPATVRLTAGGTVLTPGADFSVDAVTGDITLRKPGVAQPINVSYIPADAVTGAPKRIEVPASARPDPPKVARVTPAWQLTGPEGSIGDGEVKVRRRGAQVRVYLDRPWYSSGPGELLGVVALHDSRDTPTELQRSLVTLMGRDPITVDQSDLHLTYSPDDVKLGGTATLPFSEPPRFQFNRAFVGLVEDPSVTYNVAPYAVNFDRDTDLWFADVALNLELGLRRAPPGFFVRLALVRLQPFSIAGAEVSPVTLATVAQTVPDRSVSVVLDPTDSSKKTVLVTVEGPAYSGWRPPTRPSDLTGNAIHFDFNNAFAPHPNSGGFSADEEKAFRRTSSVLVDVQVQDVSTGLSGDLAWVPARNPENGTPLPPTALTPTFAADTGAVTWGPGKVSLPEAAPAPASAPMRLRISEIDFARKTPTSVDSSMRRPFVTFIPL